MFVVTPPGQKLPVRWSDRSPSRLPVAGPLPGASPDDARRMDGPVHVVRMGRCRDREGFPRLDLWQDVGIRQVARPDLFMLVVPAEDPDVRCVLANGFIETEQPQDGREARAAAARIGGAARSLHVQLIRSLADGCRHAQERCA